MYVALLRPERHQPLRELAGLDLHVDERNVLFVVQHRRGRDDQHVVRGLVVNAMSTNRSFLRKPSGFFVTIRTGVVRVAGSSTSPMYDTARGTRRETTRADLNGVADVDRAQVVVVDVPLHPDRRDVADHERRRGAGLDELSRRDDLLTIVPAIGARIGSSGADRRRSAVRPRCTSCGVTPKIVSAWSAVSTSVAASL